MTSEIRLPPSSRTPASAPIHRPALWLVASASTVPGEKRPHKREYHVAHHDEVNAGTARVSTLAGKKLALPASRHWRRMESGNEIRCRKGVSCVPLAAGKRLKAQVGW